MADKELILKLSDLHGVGGFEDEVREFIRGEIEPYVDEVFTDAIGNLIAVKKGGGEFKLMLDAHMDEVGFIVSKVEENGFLRFAPLGGWDPRVVLAHPVEIKTRDRRIVQGVIGAAPPTSCRLRNARKPFPSRRFSSTSGRGAGRTSRRWASALGIQSSSITRCANSGPACCWAKRSTTGRDAL